MVDDNKKMKKTFKNTGFKIYGSVDWSKACDISLIHHTREKDEEVLDKWYKIRVEFTNDSWKNKDIIMLEKSELTDLIAVLNWYSDKIDCKRNNPVKSFSVTNQANRYFIQFSKDKTKYAFKMTRYDAVRLSWLVLSALNKNFATDMDLRMPMNDIYTMINAVYWSNKQVSPTKNKEVENTSKNEKDKPIHICADCEKELDPVKEAKVIEFSNKKFWRTVCYECQKNI